MSIWRFAEYLPPIPPDARVTLGEGETPVVRSRRVGPSVGLDQLFFKLEGNNPSGSYKDRFAAATVSAMVADGKRECLATSSGNTGAALAAYCAAAGIACRIAIVETAPAAKLRQMQAYGARIFRVRGFGVEPRATERVLAELRRLTEQGRAALQISAFKYAPRGMAGVETLAFELAEQFPHRLDHVFCQAGGGGLTLAVAQGFARLLAQGKSFRSEGPFRGPAVHCVQPGGNDTIAGPLREGAPKARSVDCTSKISGLQVASVIDGDEVIPACRATGGNGHRVNDDFVYEIQARLAKEEGIFTEPAGAVAVAGAVAAAKAGEIARDAVVVCPITSVGFKDEPSLAKMVADAPCVLLDQAEEIERWVASDGGS